MKNIHLSIFLFFFLVSCEKNEKPQQTETENPKFSETKNCSCMDEVKKDSIVLAYDMKIIAKKDGKYLQFRCVSVTYDLKNETQKINCISTKNSELKMMKDCIYFNATSCEEAWTPESTLQELQKYLNTDKEGFYQLYLNDKREIEQISNHYYRAEEDVINKIEMSTYGGRPGADERLIITKDSVSYFYKENLSGKIISKKTNNKKNDWNEIVNCFNLKDFAKLKSGKSRQPIDGADTRLTITTQGKTYSVINFENDPSNERIRSLIQLLKSYQLSLENQ